MGIQWITASAWSNLGLQEVHGTRKEENNSSSNPRYTTILECPWANRHTARSVLLGGPTLWPETTNFNNMVCVDATIGDDSGRSYPDEDEQVNVYEKAFISVTYMARPGYYVKDWYNNPAYHYDEIKPEIESYPIDYRNLVWGDGTGTPPANPLDNPVAASDQIPSLFTPAETLIHHIEGWCRQLDLGYYIGFTNPTNYLSKNLGRYYNVGTLLLVNIESTPGYSFRSYRLPGQWNASPNDIEPSGRSTEQLKLYFKYHPNGWETFRRTDPTSNTTIYSYLHYNRAPYTKLTVFPQSGLDIFLTSFALPMSGNVYTQ